MKILMSGVDSEYVLSPLARELRRAGWEVLELDFGRFQGDALELIGSLKGGETIFVTSAHINLSNDVARYVEPEFSRNYPNYLSPLEIIGALSPRTCIYVPHDLLSPFGEQNLSEWRFLDLFDYVLGPLPELELAKIWGTTPEVLPFGWIKSINETGWKASLGESRNDAIRVSLFVSWISGLLATLGPQGVIDHFKPLLNRGVRIKFPQWKGVSELESIANESFPGCVVPASANSTDLILQSDVVIANFASSIHAEANYFGVPVICLQDGLGLTKTEQKVKLAGLRGVIFHDYSNREPIPHETLANHAKTRSYHEGKILELGELTDFFTSLGPRP